MFKIQPLTILSNQFSTPFVLPAHAKFHVSILHPKDLLASLLHFQKGLNSHEGLEDLFLSQAHLASKISSAFNDFAKKSGPYSCVQREPRRVHTSLLTWALETPHIQSCLLRSKSDGVPLSIGRCGLHNTPQGSTLLILDPKIRLNLVGTNAIQHSPYRPHAGLPAQGHGGKATGP